METDSKKLQENKGEPSTDKKKFRETIKTLEEEKLEDFRILIEMELMERDRRK